MADSLLADIDWTDLDSAEMTTAVRVLCITLQERFNIGACDLEGDYSTGGTPANPSDNILKDMFPYKTNSPRWTLNDGDPLINYTASGQAAQNDMIHLIENAAQHYADIEKWDDADTNKESGSNLYKLSAVSTSNGTPKKVSIQIEKSSVVSFTVFLLLISLSPTFSADSILLSQSNGVDKYASS